MTKLDTLWYTRCPVPTPLGVAAQLDWVNKEFARDGIAVRTLQDETDPTLRESHFDHTLANSFRQGGNIPAIWARSAGRDTRVLGLSWTDEAQLIYTRPGTKLRSIADLKGKRLGVLTSPKSQIDFWQATTLRAYVAALKLEGLSASDVTFVKIPRADVPLPGGGARGWPRSDPRSALDVKALLQGDVDVIFHKGSRGLETIDAIGGQVIYDIGKHPDPKVRVNNGSPRTLTVDAALVRNHPDVAVRLVKLVLQAGQWAAQHHDEAVTYVARETNSTEAAVRLGYGDDVGSHLRTDLEESSIEALDDFKNFLLEWGFLAGDFDVRAWIDPAPLAQARRELAESSKAASVFGAAATA
jgi:ABC-type nitrate/sulfonate/bicarbonate transport system substrate-binding protein